MRHQPAPAPAPILEKVSLAADAFFAPGRADLPPESRGRLEELVKNAARTNLEVVIVVGHADAVESGSAPQAMALSIRRAEAVNAQLTLLGLERNRIYTEGKGATQPVADNKTAAGRAKNRRAEIEVVGTRTGKASAPPAGRLIEVLFATNRARTGDPDPERSVGESEAPGSEAGRTTLGRAVVSVPRRHHRGGLEEPGLVRVTLAKSTRSDIAKLLNFPEISTRDPEQHFTFARPLELLDDAAFATALRQNIAASKRREALLYVHGFANSFADAAFRTAQFAYDLTDARHDVAPLCSAGPAIPGASTTQGPRTGPGPRAGSWRAFSTAWLTPWASASCTSWPTARARRCWVTRGTRCAGST
jgi:hypothetical protein